MNSIETVDILIKCPRQVQINIEEHCINEGIDFSKYFLGLHYQKVGDEVSKDMFKEEEDKPSPKANVKGKKK